MKEFVTDTHSLIWHLTQNSRISEKASKIFRDTDSGISRIYIPNIILVEIVYIIEKLRIPDQTINNVIDLFNSFPNNYILHQITPKTIHCMRSFSRDLIPDMPDRIIAASSLELGFPLITKDGKITDSGIIDTIW